jgi:hypothetical protein
MASAASPRADDPKIMEPPASMAHESSSYACAEDGYFKCPDTMSIDGDIRLDSGWFFVGFGEQSANIMRDRSMLLILEDSIVYTIY